jgi:hypothetical protein
MLNTHRNQSISRIVHKHHVRAFYGPTRPSAVYKIFGNIGVSPFGSDAVNVVPSSDFRGSWRILPPLLVIAVVVATVSLALKYMTHTDASIRGGHAPTPFSNRTATAFCLAVHRPPHPERHNRNTR